MPFLSVRCDIITLDTIDAVIPILRQSDSRLRECTRSDVAKLAIHGFCARVQRQYRRQKRERLRLERAAEFAVAKQQLQQLEHKGDLL